MFRYRLGRQNMPDRLVRHRHSAIKEVFWTIFGG
jgi:hypothetical protein